MHSVIRAKNHTDIKITHDFQQLIHHTINISISHEWKTEQIGTSPDGVQWLSVAKHMVRK